MTKEAFNKDIGQGGAYVYTQTLSGQMSNETIDEAMHGFIDIKGKTVVDIGCGDGTYTLKYAQKGAKSVLGLDPVDGAVARASQEYASVPNLSFQCQDIYTMALPATKYDIVVLRGVLHHMKDLEQAIAITCKLGREIIVMEPNGYNPVLKIIEKTSSYHIAHGEQSFLPTRLRMLFRRYGGEIRQDAYVGLVPVICSDQVAKFLKIVEPIVEAVPLVRQLGCGQYIMHIVVADTTTH